MRKSDFNEKDYDNVLLGYGASWKLLKLRINSIKPPDLTCKKIKKVRKIIFIMK